jgi:phosphoribosylanthranilate isomerase
LSTESDASGKGTVTAPPPASGTKVKVCAIVDHAELGTLAAAGVDFVGLWYGVAGGPHDLPLGRWVELAAAAVEKPAAVLVTFAKDAELLGAALAAAQAGWIQLHGYQSPGLVRKLKARAPEVKVLKVLHVKGGECLEGSLVGAYEKAGADAFLLDVVADDGRVGSTGQALDPEVASAVTASFNLPFLIAGGISEANRDRYAALAEHPRFMGIDVDTNARGADGRISAQRVDAIAHAWRADG